MTESARFRKKTLSPQEDVLIYTVLPPPRGTPWPAVRACAESVYRLIEDVPIDAVHVPEVRSEEARPGPRTVPFIPKVEPRLFGRLLQEGSHERLETIVSRRVVYTHWVNQRQWLLRTWREYGIRNLLLVGGESSRVRYPGPPVEEAARRIDRELAPQGCEFFLGGIAIPTRREEPQRLLEKARSGIRFFTTQLLYEAENAQKLLQGYHELCLERGELPRRIFLSFAPVSSKQDLEFLRWMGVEIPRPIEAEILRGWIGTAWRSLAVAERILQEILAFCREEKLNVPLGINIEHALRHNFEVSRDLALALGEIYRSYLRRWQGTR